MPLLNDIRAQPPHIRFLMFVLSVVATGGLVGALWFQSFQHDLVTLLNPEEEASIAQEEPQSSPFRVIADGFGSLRAGIASLLGFGSDIKEERPTPTPTASNSIRLFPISNDR